MEIEVDLFSGRPNPRFSLDQGLAAEFLRRVAALEPKPSTAELPDMLGYRGLNVVPEDLEPLIDIRITRGTVLERQRGGTQRALADPGRALERWLIQVGASRLEPAVVSALRQDLELPG
jgi:hypothetical protein